MQPIAITNNYFQDQQALIAAAELPKNTKFKKAVLYEEIETWNRMAVEEVDLAVVQDSATLEIPTNVAEVTEENSFDDLFANWQRDNVEKKAKKVKAEVESVEWTLEDMAIAQSLKGRKDRPERAKEVLRLVKAYGVSTVAVQIGYSTSHIRRESRARQIYDNSNVIRTMHDAGNISWAKIDDHLATKPKLSIKELEQIAIDLAMPARESLAA